MDFRFIKANQDRLDLITKGAIDTNGRLVVHPAAFWEQFSTEEIAVFCVVHGLYCIPTQELVEWLKHEIGTQPAIEIGSGNGVLAKALGIPATDNKMQDRPEIVASYAAAGQTTVKYGPNVLRFTGEEAVREFQPEVVVAAWVTHRYNAMTPERGGNTHGVVEQAILANVKRYLFVGNMSVHRDKPILELTHQEYYFPWLVSRAFTPKENFIGVWEPDGS